jgi:DNA modification methylase|tara:strand:+ start:774 stop:1631 length:858 start_codon:yes stop_codon:yes gene_type:complete
MNKIYHGDNIEVLKQFEENSLDCCVTDPPYGMGMEHWDHSVPRVDFWKEVIRVLKPGAYALSFCSPQLYHRMACAVEDAGFDIKDQIMWMITTKMPKKNKLKPAHEPIVVAQKPYEGSIQKNFEKWGVGKIDVVTTRVPWDKKPPKGWVKGGLQRRTFGKDGKTTGTQKEFGKVDANPNGRYPSNIIGEVSSEHQKYFYAPRVTRKERGEYNNHPTPKPISLMSYLVKVYCPENGIVLDPFLGSGSTAIGAIKENRKFVGIELEKDYVDVSGKRLIEREIDVKVV